MSSMSEISSEGQDQYFEFMAQHANVQTFLFTEAVDAWEDFMFPRTDDPREPEFSKIELKLALARLIQHAGITNLEDNLAIVGLVASRVRDHR